MNLEDRLRSHMQSGEDLSIDVSTSADDITAAGQKRTRRNQIGGAFAGGVLTLGVVFGATSLIGSSDNIDIASAEQDIGQLEDAASSAAVDDATAEYPWPIPAFDIVVGVDDGFAGIRNTDGVLSAIRSDDGLTWDEVPILDLPADAQIGTLAFADGLFAGTFTTFDNNTGVPSHFIGTSPDLSAWTLVRVVADHPDASLSGLTMSEDTLVSTALVTESSGDEEDVVQLLSGLVLVGPIGGPYSELPLEAVARGVERIVSTNSGFALSAFGEGVPKVSTSSDGQTWELAVPAADDNQFATIAALDGSLLSIGTTDVGGAGEFQIFRSDDGGSSWSPVDVPPDLVDAPWWSFDVVSSGDDVAILLVGESDQEVDGLFVSRHALIVSSGAGFTEIDLSPYADLTATIFVVGVSSDEVLLQVIDAPEVSDESLASSSGLVEENPVEENPLEDDPLEEDLGEELPVDVPEPANSGPRYVRVPLN